MVAPRPLLERMASLRTLIDRQGDATAEAAIAELLSEGEVARHARRMREIYLTRRETLVTALHAQLGAHLSFTLPQGGMALWIRVRDADPQIWAQRARERGVLFRAGSDFVFRKEHVPTCAWASRAWTRWKSSAPCAKQPGRFRTEPLARRAADAWGQGRKRLSGSRPR